MNSITPMWSNDYLTANEFVLMECELPTLRPLALTCALMRCVSGIITELCPRREIGKAMGKSTVTQDRAVSTVLNGTEGLLVRIPKANHKNLEYNHIMSFLC